MRSVPLGGPVVSYVSATSHCIHLTVEAEAKKKAFTCRLMY